MLPPPDPLTALAAAATEEAELGAAVLQRPRYRPAALASRMFSLTQTCGGRLTLELGAGSTETDFIAFERSYADRLKTFGTSLVQLKRLLAEEENDCRDLTPWKAVSGGPPLILGSRSAHVEQAAKDFNGRVAPTFRRTADQVIGALGRYRAAGGRRAMVSTIQLTAIHDLGRPRALLQRFAQTGFNDTSVSSRAARVRMRPES